MIRQSYQLGWTGLRSSLSAFLALGPQVLLLSLQLVPLSTTIALLDQGVRKRISSTLVPEGGWLEVKSGVWPGTLYSTTKSESQGRSELRPSLRCPTSTVSLAQSLRGQWLQKERWSRTLPERVQAPGLVVQTRSGHLCSWGIPLGELGPSPASNGPSHRTPITVCLPFSETRETLGSHSFPCLGGSYWRWGTISFSKGKKLTFWIFF